jgi:hypothetical protein
MKYVSFGLRASCARALCGVVLALGAQSSALGGAGTLTTVVTPLTLTDAVTYSDSATGLVAYVGYKVAIANTGGNTVNNIVFTGAATVEGSGDKAVFDSAQGAACATTTSEPSSIQCTIGQLTAGKSYPEFAVFFKAPEHGASVGFAGITLYAEGTGGVPNSKPPNSTQTWSATAVPLGTANPTVIKSAVPNSGGKFFTGNGVATTLQDPFATSVVVPAGPTFTTVTISESLYGGVNCNNFVTCYQSQITIPIPSDPGLFTPYLTIVLREDAANIKPGTKIESVVITYVDAGDLAHDVGPCASPITPRTDGLPCIASRVYYKSKTVPGWTPDLDGDFEWTLINLVNGGYIVR